MKNNSVLLALDFDGVIADSIEECLVVAYNAYSAFSRKSRKINRLVELSSQDILERKRLRNFIRSGQDYVYIEYGIDHNVPILNQVDFDKFCRESASLNETFFEMFYNERSRMSLQQFETWVQLNPLYPGIQEMLIGFEPKEALYVITTKKIEFANKILLANNINLLERNMFQATAGKSKKLIIREILAKRDVPARNFCFVDDQIDTLVKLNELGIQLYFALWGYNSEEQQRAAVENNILPLTLQQFLEKFSLT